MRKIVLMLTVFALCLGVFSGCKSNSKTGTDKDTPVNENTVVQNETQKEENITEKPENKEEIKEDKDKPAGEEKPVEKPQSKPELSLTEIMNKMVGAIPADQHTLSLMPAELYKDLYNVDKSIYEDVVIYGSMMSVKANEIILIKVKNESDIAGAKSVLEARKQQVYKTWEQYLPDQFEIVKKAQIKTNGKYVALIITPNTDAVANVFMSL